MTTKILIIQTAFIGDVILATSLIETVKEHFPHSRIDFLLRKGNESLLANSPQINKVHIWDKKRKLGSLIENIKNIRQEKYDYVINIQRFFNSGLMTALSGGKKTIGFDKNPLSFLFHHKVTHLIPDQQEGKPLHEVERNQKLLKAILPDLKISPQRPKLYFSEVEENKIKTLHLPQDYLVMAPASVWYTKQFHKDKWQELIAQVSQMYKVYLIGAPSDNELVSSLMQENCENLCGKLSLLESAMLMKNAKRVFVNDSAPLHLASAVNAPTTAIYCSTIPEFGYFPLAEQSIIIQRDPRLECMPCGLHGKAACPLGHFKCSFDIEIDRLIATI
ncbi:MAG: heptosyltransferase [Halobacteriovoraceae bacterium]|nr:heptosyltransferase [Halobacteriovoraceae bacterium]|tara:strand:+ start:19192 stop:20190 length:999 start_codon:yes stop_codon:yes gene_type:complete